MAGVYPPVMPISPETSSLAVQPALRPHATMHVPMPSLPIMPIPMLPPMPIPGTVAGQGYPPLKFLLWTPPQQHGSPTTPRARGLKRAHDPEPEAVHATPTAPIPLAPAPLQENSPASTPTPPLTPTPLSKRRKVASSSPLASSSTVASDLTELSSPEKPAQRARKQSSTPPKKRGPGRPRKTEVATSSPSPAVSTQSPRTRSVSAALEPLDAGVFDEPIQRDVWIEDYSSPMGIISSADLVMGHIEDYRPYFSGECDLQNPPRTLLEYPAPGAKEEFVLLFPTDRDDYQPVENLVSSMELMLTRFMTPQQSSAFGYLPSLSLTEFIYDEEPKKSTKKQRSRSPQTSTPASDSTAVEQSATSFGGVSPAPSGSKTPVELTESVVKEEVKEELRLYSRAPTIWGQIIDSLKLRDLNMFLSAVERFNALMLTLKTRPEKNEMSDDPLAHLSEIEKNIRAMSGLHHEIVRHICEETHHRTVGPHVHELNHYKAWTNKVYGEFSAKFVTELVYATGVKPTSKVLDLGSGTSHVVIQAALLSGCSALGVELRDDAAIIADAQVAECEGRAKRWGISLGGGVAAKQGDFTDSEDVRKWIQEADVIICNNYAFRPPLNDNLRRMFLDCKDGCKIVSLLPFRKTDFKLHIRNMDDPQSIMKVESRAYEEGAVSWTHEAGVYYLHTVDRTELFKFRELRGW